METAFEVVPVVVIFGVFAYMLRIYLDYRVRVKLIEKDLVDEKVKHLFEEHLPHGLPASLKWGMVLIGIGLAIILGKFFPYDIADEITLAGMFVLGGLGLLIYSLLDHQARRKGKSPGDRQVLANPVE
jgi:hypothetical protein